jgi:hypothetical protein
MSQGCRPLKFDIPKEMYEVKAAGISKEENITIRYGQSPKLRLCSPDHWVAQREET